MSNSYLSCTTPALTHCSIPFCHTPHMLLPIVQFLSVLHHTCSYPLFNSCLSYTSHAITHCLIPVCPTPHMLLPTVQFLSVIHLTCYNPLSNSYLSYTSHASTHWQFLYVAHLSCYYLLTIYICHPAHINLYLSYSSHTCTPCPIPTVQTYHMLLPTVQFLLVSVLILPIEQFPYVIQLRQNEQNSVLPGLITRQIQKTSIFYPNNKGLNRPKNHITLLSL
jgi:hypothetical protein